MLIYVNFEVADLNKSEVFYDNFLAELGAKKILKRDNEFIAWSRDFKETYLAITPASQTNNNPSSPYLVAIDRESKAEVDAMLANGVKLGGTLEQAAVHDDRDVYAGIVRDLDGHRIRVFCITA